MSARGNDVDPFNRTTPFVARRTGISRRHRNAVKPNLETAGLAG